MKKRIRYASIDLLLRKNRQIKIRKKLERIKNTDNKVCIIRRTKAHYKEGLFAAWLAIIKMIYLAKENGFTPVEDMQSEKDAYLTDKEVGHCNSWEFFFKQPAEISLQM